MKKAHLILTGLALSLVALNGCKKDNISDLSNSSTPGTSTNDLISEKGLNPDETVFAENNAKARFGIGGYVYTESNDIGQNNILVYKQGASGHLSLQSTTASGGTGTGTGLGNQGALIIDDQHEWLYAVNAGNNSVSSFHINNNGDVTLVHTVPSNGIKPVSVTTHGNLLYVVNAGSDNISGFTIGAGGSLTAISGSSQSLSATGAGAAEISFSPNGHFLYATEKATNNISRFSVNGSGVASAGTAIASTGQTPFGFGFARNNYMVVSNAAGGAAGLSSATSYSGTNSGNLSAVNGAVANNQAAACWIATTSFGRFAFATNTASDNISSYYVAPNGALYLIQAAIVTGDGPIDMVVAENNFNAYVLCSADHTIQEYNRTLLGGLNLIGNVSGLPDKASGLATW